MSENTNTPATPLDQIRQFLALHEPYAWYTEETELHRVLLRLSGEIYAYYSADNANITGDPLLAGWLLCAINRGIITVEPHGWRRTTVVLGPGR